MYSNFLDNLARIDSHELYNWLIDKRLIHDNQLCIHCNFITKLNLSKRTSDGITWKYKNSKCNKYEITLSIRTNSWLGNFNISIKSIIKAINLWAKGRTFAQIKQDVKISAPVFLRL